MFAEEKVTKICYETTDTVPNLSRPLLENIYLVDSASFPGIN